MNGKDFFRREEREAEAFSEENSGGSELEVINRKLLPAQNEINTDLFFH